MNAFPQALNKINVVPLLACRFLQLIFVPAAPCASAPSQPEHPMSHPRGHSPTGSMFTLASRIPLSAYFVSQATVPW